MNRRMSMKHCVEASRQMMTEVDHVKTEVDPEYGEARKVICRLVTPNRCHYQLQAVLRNRDNLNRDAMQLNTM